MWIDTADGAFGNAVGDIGYLVETLNTSRGSTIFRLRERPLRTNRTGVPRLSGWCGETDNMSRYARGAWKIVQIAKHGERARIVEIRDAELRAFLEKDGYPDLIAA